MDTHGVLGMARRFREQFDQALYIMTYANPVVAFGIRRFFDAARAAGVSGVILPDVPPEESADFRAAAGVPLVFLCAPTTSPVRVRLIARHTRDWIYLVSLKGVTGARAALPPDLPRFVARVRRLTDRPLCVGFGISTPAQARAVARIADGVIVGSALLRAVEDGGVAAGARLVRRLARAVRGK